METYKPDNIKSQMRFYPPPKIVMYTLQIQHKRVKMGKTTVFFEKEKRASQTAHDIGRIVRPTTGCFVKLIHPFALEILP